MLISIVLVPSFSCAVGDPIGDRPLLVAGLALQGIDFGWLASLASARLAYPTMLVPLLVAGVGIALVFPTVANAVVGGIGEGDINLASATNSSFREIGGVFGIAIAASVFAHNGSIAAPREFVDGLTPSLAVACGLSLLGAAVGLTAGQRRPTPNRRRQLLDPSQNLQRLGAGAGGSTT